MDKFEQFSFGAPGQKLIIAISFFCFLLCGSESLAQNKSYPFKRGEKMTYSMHFGWFDVGEAEVWIDPEFHYVDNVPHYLIRCNIASSPWIKFLKEIDMCFESLVRADDLRPHNSFRNLRQGKSIDIRHDTFIYGDSIRVEAYVEDIDEHRSHTFPKNELPFRDALSTYLTLRSMDLSNLKENAGVRTFFTNNLYEFYIQPDGRGKFKLDGNKIYTNDFKLIFPPSDINPKGKSGSVMVSSDARRVPLKFKLNLSLGSFSLAIKELSYE